MNPSSVRIRCYSLEEARRVVSLLRSRDVPREQIEVLSAEPIHDVGEAISGRSWSAAYALTGAALGAGAGYALASVTAMLYPINTGGMPLVSALPVGIVTYEAMMLGAVVCSLAGLLVEARLVRRLPREHSEHAASITDGEIHVVANVVSEELSEDLRIAVDSGRYGSET